MKPNATDKPLSPKQKALYVLLPTSLCIAAICSLPSLRAAAESNGLWLPDELDQSAKGISIYDRNDNYLCTVYEGKDKEPVPLHKVSPYMKKAILAAEDHNFYTHRGLDGGAIGRALIRNVQAGRIVEGASTITQQLARNLYLDKDDRSFQRKFYEAFLALQIESKYEKDKILECYLNEVYFGNGAYGIERAANKYFNKPASKLNVAESAYLAGIVRSPSSLSLTSKKQLAIARRNEVIDSMVKFKYISEAESLAAKSSSLAFKSGSHRLRYPHYVSHVLGLLHNELGGAMWARGYKVYTHLDPKLQKLAEKTLNAGMKNAPKGLDQAALVNMKLSDGAVLSMVGGLGAYEKNEYNRAVYPHTAGSIFKPFVYLSGLLDGTLSTDSLVADTPMVFKGEGAPDYKPRNFDGGFCGWMTVRDALARSRNVCAIRVAIASGLGNVINTARSAGINADLKMYPSTALGACAVSPLDMTEAYGTIARAGTRMEPQFLRKIEARDGSTIKSFTATPSRQFEEEAVAKLIDALEDVVRHGTGTRARLAGIPVAGKTGTADKGKDIWFVGFTPEYVTTVWAGSDLQKPVRGRNVTGGQIMAGLWRQYMSGLYNYYKPATKLAFAEPRIPLVRAIPMYSDETLLGYDSYDSYMNVSANSNKPPAQAWTINVDREVNSAGIASAVEVQRVAAARRREIAEMQRYEQLRAAALHDAQLNNYYGEAPSSTASLLPVTPAVREYGVAAKLPEARLTAHLPKQLAPNSLVERGVNHINDPSADKPKEEEEKKKKSDDEEDSEETEEFVLNLNQYRRHPAPAISPAPAPAPSRSGVTNYGSPLQSRDSSADSSHFVAGAGPHQSY